VKGDGGGEESESHRLRQRRQGGGREITYPEALNELVHHVRGAVDGSGRRDGLGVKGMHVLPRGQDLEGGREGGREGMV